MCIRDSPHTTQLHRFFWLYMHTTFNRLTNVSCSVVTFLLWTLKNKLIIFHRIVVMCNDLIQIDMNRYIESNSPPENCSTNSIRFDFILILHWHDSIFTSIRFRINLQIDLRLYTTISDFPEQKLWAYTRPSPTTRPDKGKFDNSVCGRTFTLGLMGKWHEAKPSVTKRA